MELNQVTLPAINIAESIAFYQRLGFTLIVDSPHYARFETSPGGASLSIHAVESLAGPPPTVIYFECPELDRKVAQLQAEGLVFDQLPADQPWLWREARLVDPSGNLICLYHAGINRLNPPWRVKT